jgi:TsgA-like MFS transporter
MLYDAKNDIHQCIVKGKTMNTIRLLIVALLAGFVIAGLLVPTGSIIGPAAEYFGVAVPEVAAQFSALTGGLFLGYICSFFVFDYVRIKTVIIVGYSIGCLTIISMNYISTIFALFAHLLVIGTITGLVSCASSSIISNLWSAKKRQTGLVAQDAAFNLGGAISAALAGYFIVQGYAWNANYFMVAIVLLLVVVLTALSSFDGMDPPEKADSKSSDDALSKVQDTEWNIGIFLIGFSLLMFMFAKAIIIVWAPQFLQQGFLADPQKASQFMSNVYTAALFGSILSTMVVSRIDVNYLIIFMVSLATLCSWLITQSGSADTILLLGYAFGIALSVTVHAYLALGLTFVAAPTHKHIAFLLLSAGLGSTIAPYLSSQVVSITGNVASSIYLSSYSLLIVLLSVLASSYIRKRRALP